MSNHARAGISFISANKKLSLDRAIPEALLLVTVKFKTGDATNKLQATIAGIILVCVTGA